ncbi:MAG: DUF362 domain-containing protein [Chitinivibrionales bacterium]|nr:DUF362 domain-containing protein [Chitinivibrionales bacterium]
MSNPVEVSFTTYAEAVTSALELLGAAQRLEKQTRVLVKPNLINDSHPPVTTPVACCEAVVAYVRRVSGAEVCVAEGCGDPSLNTSQVFKRLGYDEMARKAGVALIDLNLADTQLLTNSACTVFPEFHMPKVAMESFIISVPVLKAHSLAQITGSLKNMMGLAVPKHYQAGGHWKKSAFHRRMQDSILDLNRYRTPDLTVMDATVGLADYHLGGRRCSPPVGKIVAGYDAQAVDRRAAELLGLNWRGIRHLSEPFGGESAVT